MQEDILVIALDKTNIKVIPPTENEPEEISDTKMFITACLYRRMMDRGFNRQMQEWLDTVTEEDMRKYTGKAAVN